MIFHEHASRSLVKALTYRIVILTSDAIIIYAITRRADITLGIIGVSNFASTLLYFGHERVWNKIHWGKEKRNDVVPKNNTGLDMKPKK